MNWKHLLITTTVNKDEIVQYVVNDFLFGAPIFRNRVEDGYWVESEEGYWDCIPAPVPEPATMLLLGAAFAYATTRSPQ